MTNLDLFSQAPTTPEPATAPVMHGPSATQTHCSSCGAVLTVHGCWGGHNGCYQKRAMNIGRANTQNKVSDDDGPDVTPEPRPEDVRACAEALADLLGDHQEDDTCTLEDDNAQAEELDAALAVMNPDGIPDTPLNFTDSTYEPDDSHGHHIEPIDLVAATRKLFDLINDDSTDADW